MKLNGTIVTGLFKYMKGLTFTVNDLILYNLQLYVVLCDYDGSITPDKAEGYCKPYVEYHAYNLSDNDADDKFITPKSLMQLINSYFKGFTDNHHIQSIRCSSISELDSYVDTGAYDLSIDTELDLVNSGRYLFRVYKVEGEVYQELIDFNSGLIYTRSVSQSTFNLLANSSIKVKELNQKIQLVGSKIRTITKKANKVLNQSFNFVRKDFEQVSSDKYVINDLAVNDIIHLIVIDPGSVESIQYPVEFYISSDGMITKQSLVGDSVIKLHFHGTQGDIELTNSRHQLVHVYTSKGRTDE